MKVFISWSGERSQALAIALRDWLPLVLHFVEPWVSQSDIDAGERWATKVAKELEASSYGILAVTKENIVSPWILFEAGALARSMEEGRVIPLLLDVDFKDISGPLAQFQAKKVERAGIVEMVSAVNRLAEQPVPDGRLAELLEMAWPAFEKKISAIPKATTTTKSNRASGEVLEELVAGVRGLDVRMAEVLYQSSERGRAQRGRDPGFLIDAVRSSRSRPGDGIRVLMLSSVFREDMPWIYELALELFRAQFAETPAKTKIQKLKKRLWEALKLIRHGPMLDLIRDKRAYAVLREATHMLEYELQQPLLKRRATNKAADVALQDDSHEVESEPPPSE